MTLTNHDLTHDLTVTASFRAHDLTASFRANFAIGRHATSREEASAVERARAKT